MLPIVAGIQAGINLLAPVLKNQFGYRDVTKYNPKTTFSGNFGAAGYGSGVSAGYKYNDNDYQTTETTGFGKALDIIVPSLNTGIGVANMAGAFDSDPLKAAGQGAKKIAKKGAFVEGGDESFKLDSLISKRNKIVDALGQFTLGDLQRTEVGRDHIKTFETDLKNIDIEIERLSPNKTIGTGNNRFNSSIKPQLEKGGVVRNTPKLQSSQIVQDETAVQYNPGISYPIDNNSYGTNFAVDTANEYFGNPNSNLLIVPQRYTDEVRERNNPSFQGGGVVKKDGSPVSPFTTDNTAKEIRDIEYRNKIRIARNAETVANRYPASGAAELDNTPWMMGAGVGVGMKLGQKFIPAVLDEITMGGRSVVKGGIGAIKNKKAISGVNAFEKTTPVLKPYQINKPTTNTLHVKSTMSGSPLENQLSKSGKININNIKAHIGKVNTGKQDKYILNKVLKDKFAGKSSIDYNEFRRAVNDELIPLQKKFTDENLKYGNKALGIKSKDDIYYYDSAVETVKMREKQIIEMEDRIKSGSVGPITHESKIAKLNKLRDQLESDKSHLAKLKSPEGITLKDQKAITFGNKDEFGRGNTEHFSDEGTLGHSRTFVSKEEPNVMHIIEQQSDYYQNDAVGISKRIKKMGESAYLEKQNYSLNRLKQQQEKNIKVLNELKQKKARGIMDFLKEVRQYEIDNMEQIVKSQANENLLREGGLRNYKQKELLGKTHQERLLQENVVNAAEQGQTKMRYPTRETAAKVQHYTGTETKLNVWDMPEGLKIQNELRAMGTEKHKLINNNLGISDRAVEIIAREKELNKKWDKLKTLEKNYIRYRPEHETILKKYDNNPKLIKKTLGVDTKIVTDKQGNTWYEFDIPKSFKEGKAEIKALSTAGVGLGAAQGINKLNQDKPFFKQGGFVSGISLIGGKSHAQGGTPLNLNGVEVEAEKGEYLVELEDNSKVVLNKKQYAAYKNGVPLQEIINSMPKDNVIAEDGYDGTKDYKNQDISMEDLIKQLQAKGDTSLLGFENIYKLLDPNNPTLDAYNTAYGDSLTEFPKKEWIALHKTGSPTSIKDINKLSRVDINTLRESSNTAYYITRDGKVINFFDPAIGYGGLGKSKEGFDKQFNLKSIGIEFGGRAGSKGENLEDLTPAQQKAGKKLIAQLSKKYNIDPNAIIDHGLYNELKGQSDHVDYFSDDDKKAMGLLSTQESKDVFAKYDGTNPDWYRSPKENAPQYATPPLIQDSNLVADNTNINKELSGISIRNNKGLTEMSTLSANSVETPYGLRDKNLYSGGEFNGVFLNQNGERADANFDGSAISQPESVIQSPSLRKDTSMRPATGIDVTNSYPKAPQINRGFDSAVSPTGYVDITPDDQTGNIPYADTSGIQPFATEEDQGFDLYPSLRQPGLLKSNPSGLMMNNGSIYSPNNYNITPAAENPFGYSGIPGAGFGLGLNKSVDYSLASTIDTGMDTSFDPGTNPMIDFKSGSKDNSPLNQDFFDTYNKNLTTQGIMNLGTNLGAIGTSIGNIAYNERQPYPDTVEGISYNPVGYNFTSPKSAFREVDKAITGANRYAKQVGRPELVTSNLAKKFGAIENISEGVNKTNAQMVSSTDRLNQAGSLQTAGINAGIDQFNIGTKMNEDNRRSSSRDANINTIFAGLNNIGTQFGQVNQNKLSSGIIQHLVKTGNISQLLGNYLPR